MSNTSSSVALTTSQNTSNVLAPPGTTINFDTSGNATIFNPLTQQSAPYGGIAPPRQPYFSSITASGNNAAALQFSATTFNFGLCGYIGNTPQNVTFSGGTITFPVAGTYLIEVAGNWSSTNGSGTTGTVTLSAPSTGISPSASTVAGLYYNGSIAAAAAGSMTVIATQAGTVTLSIGVNTQGFTAYFNNGSLKISRIDTGT